MPKIEIPKDIQGATLMTPMDLNRQRFVGSHTVITPGLLMPDNDGPGAESVSKP